jgi:hypothetical protein
MRVGTFLGALGIAGARGKKSRNRVTNGTV